MNDTHTGTLLILLGLLIILSAFFSSSETSMMSLNRYRLKHLSKEGNKAARRASRLLERPDRLLGTILVGNNIVNILAASIATVVAVQIWGEAGIAIATFGLTIVILIFGEITPKTLAALRPELIAFPVSIILAVLQKVLYPIVWVCNAISNQLLRLLGVNPNAADGDQLSTEELRTVVREAGLGITRSRQNMLLGILDLEKMTVNDIMVPRNEAVGIDMEDDIDTIINQLRNCHHTRLPVYQGDINHVTGIVHMRSIARLLSRGELTKDALVGACKDPYFIPESTPLHTQLFNFQKQKRRIAIVVDEYGDVIGLVTLEDILEEIVGEFTTDMLLPSQDIHPQSDGSYVIDAASSIRDINRHLQWKLPADGPKTLNGLITEQLESIPETSVCLSIGPYRMEILQTKDNMVKSVRVWQRTLDPQVNTAATGNQDSSASH
ncbi:HlyC/CorC family transporter [Halopseudomonas phragmitis]|uniref:Magnesium and cobalt efflux protein CorC n=2 Tax=Pseudomonadaceae TaxID=135621 RepID=A0A1V0B0C6_9GAMM|nr:MULTISPECIES: HlyC/CorC family transporter [Pseudomonadaceae]AQZ93392.1 magnesium/cobalt efflux protein [Halopseudomonas phragmitis]RHW19882.1 HlyC/CorC family transporter [Pseudomonas jilinensis]